MKQMEYLLFDKEQENKCSIILLHHKMLYFFKNLMMNPISKMTKRDMTKRDNKHTCDLTAIELKA